MKGVLLGTVASGCLLFSVAGYAAESSGEPAPADQSGKETPVKAASKKSSDETSIETITVTARKVDENLKDVPISVSVIGADQIQARGATQMSDLQFAVPNFTFNGPDTSVQPSVTIRGINVDQRSAGVEAGYGIYIDGVLAGRVSSLNQDLFDIERVEILRGPQGTLFGKNTIAGAINVVTAEPTDELQVKATTRIGNYGERYGGAYVSGPIVEDKLYGKFTIYDTKHDGYVENVTTGSHPDNDDRWGTRGALRFAPVGSGYDFTLAADYMKRDRISYLNEILAESPGFATAYPGYTPGIRTINSNRDRNELQKQGGLSLTGNFDLTDVLKLTSVTAYRGSSSDYGSDYDNRAIDLTQFNLTLDEHEFSQEVRVASQRIGDFDFLVGAYYFNGTTKQYQEIVSGTDIGVVLPLPAGYVVTSNSARVQTKSYAAFTNANWYLTDRLTANLGARYTHETKDLVFNVNDLFTPFILTDYRDSLSSNDVSPTASLVYKLTPEMNVYTTISQGFKSGGWNAEFVTNTNIAFKDEKVTNYEAGLKGQWLNGRLAGSVSVFHLDYKDLQVTQTDPVTNRPFTTNAGRATSNGFEVEATVVPLSGLVFTAGAGYSHATYDQYKAGSVSYDGKRLVNSPLWTLNLSGTYTVQLPSIESEAYLRVDYGYRGSSYDTAANLDTNYTPSNQVVNARLGMNCQNWEGALYVNNALNRDDYRNYFSGNSLISGVIPVNQTTVNYLPPRTFGLELTYKY